MTECIERLMRCGVPEETARRICKDFTERDQIAALFSYIETEERERGIR